MPDWAVMILCSVITQILVTIFTAGQIWKTNHNKKKFIQDQISCKKREIWDIQKQLTAICCSNDKQLLESEYVRQICERLKNLKNEIANLNSQLKPEDQDKTKLNISEALDAVSKIMSQVEKTKGGAN